MFPAYMGQIINRLTYRHADVLSYENIYMKLIQKFPSMFHKIIARLFYKYITSVTIQISYVSFGLQPQK
jgi:hypothetical protein